jgi:hypothetical protein
MAKKKTAAKKPKKKKVLAFGGRGPVKKKPKKSNA